MDNEILLSMRDDDNLESFEDNLINTIKMQILNVYGEFTGEIQSEVDHISDYIKKIYTNSDTIFDVIDNFEWFCTDSGREEEYDYLVSNLVSVFKETMGIVIDIDREILSFSDLYDIYLVFVLSIKNTIVLSTKGFLYKNGNDDSTITKQNIIEYILTDEFSSNDDFISNASYKSDNLSIIMIKDFINDNVISIDQKQFMIFIQNLIDNIIL